MSSVVDPTSNRDTHHLHHEWTGDGSVSEKIVEVIAECEDMTRSSLPPLEDCINPEAMDTMFESTEDDTCRAGCITFSYYGYTVLVQSTGQILIKEQ